MASKPDKVIRIVDDVDAESWIRDREYRDAVILGPAVLLPAGGVVMQNVSFSGIPDSIFIELPPGKPAQGVVGLQSVTFVDCVFHDIAIIGTAQTLALYRQAGEQRVVDQRAIWDPQAAESARAEAPEQPAQQ